MPTAHLHHVYAAALAASGDQAVAEQVSERMILGGPRGDRAALVERAVLLSIRTSPHDAFAPMRADEREVLTETGLDVARDRPVVTICPFIVGDHATPTLVEQVAENHTGILAPADGGYDRVR